MGNYMSTPEKYFRPRNWSKWQDCRFKNADWIKNWSALLDDLEYHQLTLIQRAVLHGLWLAWGRLGRPLPWDCSYLGRLLVCDCNSLGKALPALETNGFIELCERTDLLFERQSSSVSPPETETDTETEIKKEEAIASSKEKTRRGSRLPDVWAPPSEITDALKTEGFTDADFARELSRFRDYWIAVPGQRGCKLDWGATFRNWMRTARERSGGGGKASAGNGSGKRSSGGGLVGAGLRRAAALYAVEDGQPGGSWGGHSAGGNGHSAPTGGTELDAGAEDNRDVNDPFGGGFDGGLPD